ncbi:hypothetical protein [Ensifer sp.]|uniref:hypothetical protein n=1 Tax=Ensifer sp. TaxID=1872086 RepID=UPI00289E4E99|nr:hypothetical protein [Ensifer sp.]
MRSIRFASFAVALLTLASCAPSQGEYEKVQTAVQGSPALQRAVLKDCLAARWTKSELEAGALLLSVPVNKVQTLTCKRMVSALATGRLTYADVRASQPTVNLIKIMQGR